jgi:hypothetical protein
MMRLVVWINGLPLLLGKNESATEENVDAALARMGRPPLSNGGDGRPADEINGVSTVWMRGAVVGSLEMKYPETR